jgi:hypothetical protein
MRHTVKSIFSVAGTDSRFSDAPERNAVEVHLNTGLIHGSAPKRETLDKLVNCALVPAKDVAGKWLGARFDLRYRFVQVGVSEDR